MSASSPEAFEVSPVNFLEDWDQVFATYWHSWSHPLQALGELTFPHLGTSTSAKQESFERLKRDYLTTALAHRSRIHWIKCVDLRTAAIVGGGCYEVHLSDPYRDGKPVFSVDGFEKGSSMQVLSKSMYEQLLEWRVRLTSGPHILGTAFWIIPTYRSQGLNTIIFDYVVAVWDKLDLEAYMEGTVFSSSTALRYGFLCVAKHIPKFTINAEDSEWSRIVSDIQANPVSILWRPKHSERHHYLQGSPKIFPWNEKPRVNKL